MRSTLLISGKPNRILFFSLLFIFFATAFIMRPWLFEKNERIEERYSYDFDVELIVADMMQNQQSQGIALIASRLDKERAAVWMGDQPNAGECLDAESSLDVVESYARGVVFPDEFFTDYSSNIVAHRLLHYLVQAISPLAPRYDLMLIISMHALLSALAYTIICGWLRTIVGVLPVCIAALVLVLSRPFYGYAAEVYFASWTLLFPLCSMIVLISSDMFERVSQGKQIALLSTVSFVACCVKFSCYFEFATTSMIAMTLPVIYLIVQQKMSIVRALKYFTFPSIAAITAFLFIFVFKYSLLSIHLESLHEAYQITVDNLNARVAGNEAHLDPVIRDAATRRLDLFIRGMLNLTIIEYRGASILTIWGCIIACLYASAWHLYRFVRLRIFSGVSLMVVTWISLLAPLSWMVLAKPHAAAHHSIIAPLWHFPFVLFAATLFFHCLYQQTRVLFLRKADVV